MSPPLPPRMSRLPMLVGVLLLALSVMVQGHC